MWRGTQKQYFELYEITSNYLKEKFPYIKIGGYASCGFYALYGDSVIEEANVSVRCGYFIEFFQEFLKYISSDEHKSPLDFFSWHSYDGVKNNCRSSLYVREQLDKYGFTNTESILNEWNPGTQRRGTEEDACCISEMICALHKTPLDMLMYYDGQVHGAYQGLFNPLKNDIFPAYYAIHSFNELYMLKNEVCIASDGGLPIIAAGNEEKGKILIPNSGSTAVELNLELKNQWKAVEYRILEGIDGLVQKELMEKLCIPPRKIVMIECRKNYY